MRSIVAQALLFEDQDPGLFHDLAVASYYAKDLKTASFAIKRAQSLSPNKPHYFATAAMLTAAEGRREEALQQLEDYRNKELPLTDKCFYNDFLKRRIDDWKVFHEQMKQSRVAEFSPPNTTPIASDASRATIPITTSSLEASRNAQSAQGKGNEMCLIDVVIIKSEQSHATNKGINLLSGLQMQFGGSAALGKTWGTSNARNGSQIGSFPVDPDVTTALSNTQGFNHSQQTTNGKTQALTSTITIPTINYNLNIFNSATDHNEVLARPTLVATDGTPSEFFSGATIRVGMQGGVGIPGLLQEIPVGVKLVVTPSFIDENRVKLEVESSREFWENGVTGNTFQQSLITSKTRVLANVTMGFSETLILSGLTEKVNSKVKDGVPILKDLPIFQYLFSNEKTSEFTKSVLILLSPHHPRYTNREKTEELASRGIKRTSASVRSLQKRFEPFFPAHNLDAVYQQLQDQRFFNEYRRGDVSLEKWDNFNSYASKLNHALEFIYY